MEIVDDARILANDQRELLSRIIHKHLRVKGLVDRISTLKVVGSHPPSAMGSTQCILIFSKIKNKTRVQIEAEMVVRGVEQVDIATVKAYAQDLRGLL